MSGQETGMIGTGLGVKKNRPVNGHGKQGRIHPDGRHRAKESQEPPLEKCSAQRERRLTVTAAEALQQLCKNELVKKKILRGSLRINRHSHHGNQRLCLLRCLKTQRLHVLIQNQNKSPGMVRWKHREVLWQFSHLR